MAYTKTPIIPIKQTFIGYPKTLNYEAICVFAATGFFLDSDTYFKEQLVLKPATAFEIDIENQKVIASEPYFKWHYSPVDRSLNQIVTEFAELFETIIQEQVLSKPVILPLSGGLDSRTLAAAMQYLKIPVSSYSYSFQDGHDESSYGKKIAEICNFPFQNWKVPYGYLWGKLEQLATINGCMAEFTHPRQMAFLDKYPSLGNQFFLGHWGDVLFSNATIEDQTSLNDQVTIISNKIIKKGGLELAESLWKTWKLKGDFTSFFKKRITELLLQINIPQNANAQLRAFKSLFWAPRWTSVNLAIFEEAQPMALPYYDNRMCEFICTVPEKYLSGRQIQIEYIKMRMPALAKITWQEQKPFNLFTYHFNKFPYNFPYRSLDKMKRILAPKKHIQRNWELQFLGKKNDEALQKRLFDNPQFVKFIDTNLVRDFYKKFKEIDDVTYSHPVSMLLTLSVFCTQNCKQK